MTTVTETLIEEFKKGKRYIGVESDSPSKESITFFVSEEEGEHFYDEGGFMNYEISEISEHIYKSFQYGPLSEANEWSARQSVMHNIISSEMSFDGKATCLMAVFEYKQVICNVSANMIYGFEQFTGSSQKELANKSGIAQPNISSMFKKGNATTKNYEKLVLAEGANIYLFK